MQITLGILVITTVFFIQGKFRTDLVALCALLGLSLFGILTPGEALAGFSNSVVIMMVGLFVVGAGIFRTGLAKMISSKILLLAGNNQSLLFILVMLVTAFVGAFISNTGTVAVMMPIVISMAASAGHSPSRYLMPMAFASSMGLFTLISTPPNLVIQEALVNGGYEPLSFFSFAPVGLVAVGIGVVLLFFLSKMLVSKEQQNDTGNSKRKKVKSLTEILKEYNLQKQLHKIEVPEGSPLLGKPLADLAITTRYGITIVKITPAAKNNRFRSEETPGAQTVIHPGDVIYCQGNEQNIETFIRENGLVAGTPEKNEFVSQMQNDGLAEVFILPTSEYINHTIKEIRFRENFNVNVVGIQRNRDYRIDDFSDVKLQAGDGLLVQGSWEMIAALGEVPNDLVLVGQPLKEASKITLDHKAPVAALIMILMIAVMAFDVIPAVIAVLLASVFMVMTGCLRNMEEAYGSINWQSIVLIAAMLPMSTAFEKTGVTTLISGFLLERLGDMGPYILLAGVYFCTSLMTMVVSNTATAVLLAPIGMQTAISMGVSPYPFLFAVAVAASMCFASPFSTPPNALVMSAGGYRFMDYVKVGLPLQLIMGIIMILVLPLLFPF